MSVISKLLKKLKRRGHSQTHFTRPALPWEKKKPEKGHYKKRKSHSNIPDEHRFKNPQWNTSKPNLIAHYKDHMPWSSGIYP